MIFLWQAGIIGAAIVALWKSLSTSWRCITVTENLPVPLSAHHLKVLSYRCICSIFLLPAASNSSVLYGLQKKRRGRKEEAGEEEEEERRWRNRDWRRVGGGGGGGCSLISDMLMSHLISYHKNIIKMPHHTMPHMPLLSPLSTFCTTQIRFPLHLKLPLSFCSS